MATAIPAPSAQAASESTAPPRSSSSPFPFATAPDIIRAHQKDAYFQGLLTTHLVDLHRRLFGARSSHAWAAESRTAADLLYLCLTTLLGNRTLGEEYCDLIQVEAPQPASPSPSSRSTKAPSSSTPAVSVEPITEGPRLPSLGRRSAYITLSILAPYALSRTLPTLRARLRARLETRLAALKRTHPHSSTRSLEYRIKRYLLTHLSSLTSGAHVHALVLATFYFTGAYYSLSKRFVGLRYVFTRRLPEHPSGVAGAGADGRAGYEVLGVLLVVQLAVQAYMHIRATLAAAGDEESVEAAIRERAFGPSAGTYAVTGNVSLDHGNSYSGNNDLLLSSGTGTLLGGGGTNGTGQQRSKEAIARMAHTPLPSANGQTKSVDADADAARYDLRDDSVLGWIKGQSQRKCTLCLEELKDPSATGCGHVFCWTCIGDWVREKPECPLCRREVMVQHILPLRA